MNTLPSFNTYGNYSSNNYGAHALVFTDAQGNRFWFSYKTLIAFDGPQGSVVLRNYWSTTTGKHLNAIDGGGKHAKAERVTQDVFKEAFAKQFGRTLETA